MTHYTTAGGVTICRTIDDLPVDGAIQPVQAALDSRRGVLLASSYEYPGRYTRWDIGFVDPPLAVTCRTLLAERGDAGSEFEVAALNDRGKLLLEAISRVVEELHAVVDPAFDNDVVRGKTRLPDTSFTEEERSRQPSIFSVLRAIIALFAAPDDPHLGLYGAFGYDLAFQFEPATLRLARPPDRRDLVLYLPDEIVVVDHRRERAERRRYDFSVGTRSTAGLPRTGCSTPFVAGSGDCVVDHEPGEYADIVRQSREAFKRGDLFEVVPGQTFSEPCYVHPSVLFQLLRERNPAPYGCFINLGDGEYLVGASPEMYVRVDGDRVETCPISGTVERGRDPIGDAGQIRLLLNSAKDEAELTMCTDVDRNDKSRICRPGSVRVLGRRQIEMYSRVIHTVDHVEGRLRRGFDALDAFLTHAWAVTVTGAPKARAMQFLEDHEKSPRAWYGGAIGWLGFNGTMNTGLTLRTVRIIQGIAEVRAGATLLFDSDPEEEERETRLKAAAFLEAVKSGDDTEHDVVALDDMPGAGKSVLLVDHQDSFVHTLANYLRQTGAEVTTLRFGFRPEELDRLRPDLLVLSPGPGRPEDFQMAALIEQALARQIPVFGVCLGLQGLVEYFGGELAEMPLPVHGKASRVSNDGTGVFAGLPDRLLVARYHSLCAVPASIPSCLRVTSRSEDGNVMAIEHRERPVIAVQFHPESILTLADDHGLRLVQNAVRRLTKERTKPSSRLGA
ncbi:MAG: anthranilate synthase component I [Chloroflexota bacterium]